MTRRGFVQALVTSLGALVAVGAVWFMSRNAPSAGRDPELTPPALAPTRAAPTATPGPEVG